MRDAGSASSAHGRCVCAAAGAEGGARHQRSIASRIGTPPAAEAYSAHALSLKSASCSQHECTKAPLPARSQPPGRVTSATKRRENALRLAMASGVHVRRGGGRLARRAAAARTCERRESGVRGGVRAAQREAEWGGGWWAVVWLAACGSGGDGAYRMRRWRTRQSSDWSTPSDPSGRPVGRRKGRVARRCARSTRRSRHRYLSTGWRAATSPPPS